MTARLPIRKEYLASMPGAQETSYQPKTQAILHRALLGARYLEEQGRLSRSRRIDQKEFNEVLRSTVRHPEPIGRGGTAVVYWAKPTMPGGHPYGYAEKVYTLDQQHDGFVPGAARSLWVTLDKKLENLVIEPVGYVESEDRTFNVFQKLSPYMHEALLRQLQFNLYQGGSDEDILSAAFLLHETVAFARELNQAGYVDRDLKPANLAVDITDKHGTVPIYHVRSIDPAEFIPMGRFASEMKEMRDTFTDSDAASLLYCPTRMLQAGGGIIGDMHAQERALRTKEHDNVIMLGYILGEFVHNFYQGAQVHGSMEQLYDIINAREEYKQHIDEMKPMHPALHVFIPAIKKALDEERVEAGKYTILQLEDDIGAAVTRILTAHADALGKLSLPQSAIIPTDTATRRIGA